jgi:hypothetical protein
LRERNFIKNGVKIMLLCISTLSFSQNVDLDNLGGFIGKGKPLKISGGFSANSIFYNSSQDSGREAFTYFLQGNINVSFMALSVPISYSYSNQVSQLDYEVPFKFESTPFTLLNGIFFTLFPKISHCYLKKGFAIFSLVF